MRRFLTGLVVLALIASPAAADVLCRGKEARVFLRATCKAREAPVELPKGVPGAPGLPAPAPLRVVDAAGVQLGLFAEPGRNEGETRVVFEAGGRIVAVGVRPSGFTPATLYHLTTDCSGQPLGFVYSRTFVRRGSVVGSTAYAVDDPITTVAPVARQEAPAPGGCGADAALANGNCCRVGQIGAGLFGPAVDVFSTSAFTPPFRLRP